MKTRVFNLIILDESGSMSAIERQAISGVNETIQTIRIAQKEHPEQEHFVSLVSFNSVSIKNIYDKINAEDVEELSGKQYQPSSCTPLYDAMGNALTSLSKSVSEEDVVLVTVITDGYENDSKEYSCNSIKALVESLKKRHWLFTYIGANQDVYAVASSLAIDNTLNFETTAEGTNEMFETEGKARRRFFDSVSCCASPSARYQMVDNFDYFSDNYKSKSKHKSKSKS
jgi:uncharacterized protein YegL